LTTLTFTAWFYGYLQGLELAGFEGVSAEQAMRTVADKLAEAGETKGGLPFGTWTDKPDDSNGDAMETIARRVSARRRRST